MSAGYAKLRRIKEGKSMATLAEGKARQHPLAPDTYERVLSMGAIILLLMVVGALVRGYGAWSAIKPLTWAHLLSMATALALTPIMLLRPRGTMSHRQIGWVWAILMFGSAFVSFWVRGINHGSFSPIHVLSAIVTISVPLTVLAARRHKVSRHRRGIRALVTGGLLTAGFFTFPFDRLLGHWLFG
jgi:uncharacterized membrane protein